MDVFHWKGTTDELAQFVRVIYEVVSSIVSVLLWNKLPYENKNKNKNIKNMNHSQIWKFWLHTLVVSLTPIMAQLAWPLLADEGKAS